MRKIVVFILFMFILVSCGADNKDVISSKGENNKKEEINIEKKKENNFEIKKFNKDIKKISFIELNNSLYSNGGGDNLYEKINILSSSGATEENKFKAIYLESFVGDYKNALKNRKELCSKKENTNLDFCKKIKLDLVSYRAVDNKGNSLKDVKIFVDGIDYGKLKGKNNFDIENKFFHRIRISKEGYLDFYKKIFVDKNNFLQESLNPKLLKADLEKTIKSNKMEKIKTDNFKFSVSPNTFKTRDGKIYSGDVKMYIFDIGGQDGNLNILNLDAFDENGTYIGGSMVTHGMPLVKAYDQKGNELSIGKEIKGKGRIQNIEKAVGIDLNGVEKNKYLSKKELDKYNIPPFWHLDQKNGVWKESKMKIIDSNGNYEFILK